MKSELASSNQNKPQDPLRFLNRYKKKDKSMTGSVFEPTKNENDSLLMQVQKINLKDWPENVEPYASLQQPTKSFNIRKYFNPQIEQFLNRIDQQQQQQHTLNLSMQLSYENSFIALKPQQMTPTLMKIQQDESLQLTSPNQFKINSKPQLNEKDNRVMQPFQTFSKNMGQGNNAPKISNNGPQHIQIQLHECQQCGRKFNFQAYEKHSRICEKVFMKKRKSFDSAKQRSRSGSREAKK